MFVCDSRSVVTSDDEVNSSKWRCNSTVSQLRLLVCYFEGNASSDDEVQGHKSGQLVPQKRQLSRGVEDSHVPRTIASVDYGWLTNCFKPL